MADQAPESRPIATGARRPNILFSTTRQWNCGDEFILFGIRRLLQRLGSSYNPIIYNRHPSITPQRVRLPHPWSGATPPPHYDNSFILDDPGLIDYVIFAGTPEWFGGPRIAPLIRFVLERDLRCAFIGVGVHRRHQFSADLCRVLNERCDLITARDPLCYELIRGFPNSYHEVCPALFSAPCGHERGRLERIALPVQAGDTEHHSIPDEVSDYCAQQFARLEADHSVCYIAHYIDDAKLARAQGKPCLYSAYAEDYAGLYDQFDMVISTRVHGCGMASSLGIPNALIPHDGRHETVLGFQSHIAHPGTDLAGWVRSVDIGAASARLVDHRNRAEERFARLLADHLSILD